MPEMDGITLGRALRKAQLLEETKLFLPDLGNRAAR